MVQCDGATAILLVMSFYRVFLFSLQIEEEPDVVLVKVEEGTRQTSLSIQEGELMLATGYLYNLCHYCWSCRRHKQK